MSDSCPPSDRRKALMEELVKRGIAALQLYVSSLPVSKQPAGGAGVIGKMKWNVITAEDFALHADVIRKYVCENKELVHILSDNGSLCALLEPRKL